MTAARSSEVTSVTLFSSSLTFPGPLKIVVPAECSRCPSFVGAHSSGVYVQQDQRESSTIFWVVLLVMRLSLGPGCRIFVFFVCLIEGAFLSSQSTGGGPFLLLFRICVLYEVARFTFFSLLFSLPGPLLLFSSLGIGPAFVQLFTSGQCFPVPPSPSVLLPSPPPPPIPQVLFP